MAPTNHLADKSGYTHELIAALTDDELDELIAYYRERHEWYTNTPDEVKPKNRYQSNAYAAYRYGNWVSMAEGERSKRRGDGWRTQFTTKHVCRVCGETATVIEDDGWACNAHREALPN